MSNALQILIPALLLFASSALAQGGGDEVISCASVKVAGVMKARHTVWTVDDDVLAQHDLKDVVDCAGEGDVVLLKASKAIVPKATVMIPKSIAIEGQDGQTSILSCPDGTGLFIVEDGDLTLKDVRIENCSTKGDVAVIDIDAGMNASDVRTLSLDRVGLKDVRVDAASSKGCIHVRNPDGVEVIMKDVSIEEVRSPPCQLAKTNTFVDVRFVDNAVVGDAASGFFSVPSNSVTRCTNATVSGTDGTMLHADGGTVEITNSNFVENGHATVSGVVNVRRSELIVTDSVFRSNAYDSGSCISADASSLFIDASTFSGNKAQTGGGCVHVTHLKELNVARSEFSDNVANTASLGSPLGPMRSGGAIEVLSSASDETASVVVYDSRFERNSAERFGGGLSLSGEGGRLKANVEINDTVFESNVVQFDGAALYFNRLTDSEISLNNCTFLENKASGSGVCLTDGLGTSGNILSIRDCTFQQNTGYAVEANSFDLVPCELSVIDCGFVGYATPEESKSDELRGGVRVEGHAISLSVTDGAFRNLRSPTGAAIDATTLKDLAVMQSVMTDNKGGHGGAVTVGASSSAAYIEDCIFSFNTADSGGAIYSLSDVVIDSSRFEENTATQEGGAVASPDGKYIDVKESRFEGNKAKIGGGLYAIGTGDQFIIESEFLENEATLFGGAIAFTESSSDRVSLLVSLIIQYNTAAIGGGIYVSRGDNDRTAVNIDDCTIEGNKATRAGGGVYMDTLRVATFDDRHLDANASMNRPHPSIKDNTVGPQGYGPQVATSSSDFYVNLHFGNGRVVGPVSTNFSLDAWRSVDAFPIVEVVMVDAFGSEKSLTKTAGVGKRDAAGETGYYGDRITATMTSETQFIRNALTTDVSSGVGFIDAGRPIGRPGKHSVDVSVEGIANKRVVIDVLVRGCGINEKAVFNGSYCERCDYEHYNFDPQSGICRMCPKHANCSTKWIVPRKGYWNASPMSPTIDRCLLKEACLNLLLQSAAIDLVVESPIQNGITNPDYNALLCRDGYEGPLCGSCAEGWGRARDFECRDCYSISWVVTGIVAILALLMLSLLLVGINMDSSNQLPSGGILSRAQKKEFWDSLEDTDPVEGTATVSLLPTSASRSPPPLHVQILRWKFQETLKVGINFLQTIAIGLALDVSWTKQLIDLFRTWDVLGGIGTNAFGHLLDCWLPYDASTPRSIPREMLVSFIPGIVFAAVSIYWLIKLVRWDINKQMTRRRCLLTIAAVSYVSYVSIVRTAMRTFDCVRVHDDALDDADDVHRYYWAVDTAVRCNSGSHVALLCVVGIPGLIFALVFPVALVFALVLLSKHDGLNLAPVQETLGIFINGYKRSFVYWDAIILVRKAALLAVFVLGRRLEANRQGHLGIFILVVALLLTLFNPFKSELTGLNTLESISLLLSILTFMVGLFLDDGESGGIKALLTTVVFVSNIVMVVVLIAMLLHMKVVLIKHGLVENGVDCNDKKGFDVLKVWMQYKLGTLPSAPPPVEAVEPEVTMPAPTSTDPIKTPQQTEVDIPPVEEKEDEPMQQGPMTTEDQPSDV